MSQGVELLIFSPIHKLFYGLAGYWGYQSESDRWCLAFIQRKVRPPRLLLSSPREFDPIMDSLSLNLFAARFHPVTHPVNG